MELKAGDIAVVTGAASGIGLALAERFARAGMHIVLADVDEGALQLARSTVGGAGVETLAVVTDVSDERSVHALAAATLERFGAVHLLCNNAGVSTGADPWFGPREAWSWVLGVNLWGVIHGVRAFLPSLAAQPQSYVVNTASIAGVMPGAGTAYDASKHAVVALSDDLYTRTKAMGLTVGVSVLCPGWVRTNIVDADRNWPSQLGDRPAAPPGSEVIGRHVRRAIAEGATPAAVADAVADAVEADQFWVFPQAEFLDAAVRRWHDIAESRNPIVGAQLPGLPSTAQIAAEIAAEMAKGAGS